MSQHHLTTHAHNGATDESSGTCAPHRFTGREAPPNKKSFAGPVQWRRPWRGKYIIMC